MRIGRVCLEVLKATGVPLKEVLQTIGKGERWYHTGEDGGMVFAGQCDGQVEASLEMRNGYWNGTELSLVDPDAKKASAIVGRGPDVYTHPAFAEMLSGNEITKDRSSICVKIANPAVWLIDLESGRIWQGDVHDYGDAGI